LCNCSTTPASAVFYITVRRFCSRNGYHLDSASKLVIDPVCDFTKLALIGIFMRLQVHETPAFEDLKRWQRIHHAPFSDVVGVSGAGS
jgi:hypothetical protein